MQYYLKLMSEYFIAPSTCLLKVGREPRQQPVSNNCETFYVKSGSLPPLFKHTSLLILKLFFTTFNI